MTESATAAMYALFLDRMMNNCVRSIEDLSVDELNHLPQEPHGRANSIGFDIWHVARTADNILFFVFEREPPVWLRDGFDTRFDLPKVAQGTGMPTEEARSLHFPDPALFLDYVRALREVCVPRVAGMTDEYLASAVLLRPWGELPRVQHLLQMLTHSNSHLGKASNARMMLGRDDLGF